MRITEQRQGDVLVLNMVGRMTIGEGDGLAGETIRERIAAGEQRIVLDMRNVPVMDSAGVGELILCYKAMTAGGGAIKLLGLTPRVGDTLKCSMLTGLFDMFEDDEEALASFR